MIRGSINTGMYVYIHRIDLPGVQVPLLPFELWIEWYQGLSLPSPTEEKKDKIGNGVRDKRERLLFFIPWWGFVDCKRFQTEWFPLLPILVPVVSESTQNLRLFGEHHLLYKREMNGYQWRRTISAFCYIPGRARKGRKFQSSGKSSFSRQLWFVCCCWGSGGWQNSTMGP